MARIRESTIQIRKNEPHCSKFHRELIFKLRYELFRTEMKRIRQTRHDEHENEHEHESTRMNEPAEKSCSCKQTKRMQLLPKQQWATVVCNKINELLIMFIRQI